MEDLETLRLFNQYVLRRVQDEEANPDKPNKKYYKSMLLIDGNDKNKFIDVAIMSRFEILGVRTHMFDEDEEGTISTRDCLEVDMIHNLN